MGHHHRRRSGLALLRYCGDHRQNGMRLTPWDLVDHVAVNAEHTRRAHCQSLRRRHNPGPVLIGTHYVNVKFFGVPSSPEEPLTIATLLAPPDDSVASVPALRFGGDTADDAPTGPLMTLRDDNGDVDWRDDLAAHITDTLRPSIPTSNEGYAA